MPIPNDAPYEVIASPFEAYLAPVETEFPAIDVVPPNPWSLIGVAGAHNFTDEGVTIEKSQTMQPWRGLRSTGPRKIFRTEEMLRIAFQVADMTLEVAQVALNGNAITTVAPGADPGHKWIGLMRGIGVTRYALLLRGPSPYVANLHQQYEIPIVVHDGEPELVYSRNGEPAVYAYEFQALIDPTQATEAEWFGRLRAVHQPASS